MLEAKDVVTPEWIREYKIRTVLPLDLLGTFVIALIGGASGARRWLTCSGTEPSTSADE